MGRTVYNCIQLYTTVRSSVVLVSFLAYMLSDIPSFSNIRGTVYSLQSTQVQNAQRTASALLKGAQKPEFYTEE